MNAYAEPMKKIVKLDGWEWEWGFGDRVWHETKCHGLVTGTSRYFVYVYFENCGRADEKEINIIPFPTMEQWDKKFYAAKYDLHVERRGTTFIVAVVNHDTHERHENNCHESILMRSIAELFARVVLGYRYVDGEFVKEKANASQL